MYRLLFRDSIFVARVYELYVFYCLIVRHFVRG